MILLTGSTGFLGGAFFLDAFRKGEAADYILLVRGSDETACRERVARNIAKHSDPETARIAVSECAIIVGDLASLASNRDPRLDEVTHIVHAAADTSFDARTSVWQINVDGTLAVAARARRMPKLQRFLHVGTAFCCGEAPRHEMVPERAPAAHDAPHIVEYTRSKASCELALAAAYADLPIIVARPSIVVGHSKLGCKPSSSIFWFYRLVDRTGVLPTDPDGYIDIVPVDWVSARLHDLLRKPKLRHKLYHVSAGAGARTSWTAFAEAFAAHGHDGARPYEHFDFRGEQGWKPFNEAFRRAFPERTVLNRTIAMGARKYHRFVAQDIAFDNARLLDEGFAPPPRFADYMGECLKTTLSIAEQFLDDAESFGFGTPAHLTVAAEALVEVTALAA